MFHSLCRSCSPSHGATRPPAAAASVAGVFLAFLGLVSAVAASSSSTSAGSIAIFSDSSCADSVVSYAGSVKLDACIPASTTGNLSLTFIVAEKPVCQDNSRPDLVLFEDPCCAGDAIANYIPDASYGDYGNGSCQHLIGGGFRALVFACGKFHVPTPSSIVASSTFPATSSQTSVPIPAVCLATVTSSTTTTTPGTGDATTLPSQTTTAPASASSKTSGSVPERVMPPAIMIGIISFAALMR